MTLSTWGRAALAGLAVTAALSSTALPSTAQAATLALVSASPGTKDGYRPFPRELRLTFSQPVAPSSLDIQLMDPDGRRIRLADPVISKDTVSLKPELGAGPPVNGPYMVTWRAKAVSGDDGQGDFSIFVE